MLKDGNRLRSRLADRLEAARPGRPRGDEPDMADDRNALRRELRNRVETPGAIEGVAAGDDAGMRGPQIVLVGAVLAVDEADLDETVARRLAHRRRPDRLDDREEVDAGRSGRGGFVRRIDEQHRQLSLALERAQIGDRLPIVFGQGHFVTPSRGLPAGMTRQRTVDKAARFGSPLDISENSAL